MSRTEKIEQARRKVQATIQTKAREVEILVSIEQLLIRESEIQCAIQRLAITKAPVN